MPLDFTAIDFETANPQRNSACAVGLTRVRDGKIVERFSQFICPIDGPESVTNTWVHGIGPEHVRHAQVWPEVFPKIKTFVGRDVMVAHNASFDRSVLMRTSEAYGFVLGDPEMLCTVKAAKAQLTLASYSLPAVSYALGLPHFEHHDAGADADAAARLAVGLARRAGVDDVRALMPVERVKGRRAGSVRPG